MFIIKNRFVLKVHSSTCSIWYIYIYRFDNTRYMRVKKITPYRPFLKNGSVSTETKFVCFLVGHGQYLFPTAKLT